MVTQEILKFCLEKGILLDKETGNFLSCFDDDSARKIIDKISSFNEKIITKSFITENAEKLEVLIGDKTLTEKLKINLGITFEISREKIIKTDSLKEKFLDKKESLELDHLKVLYSLVNLGKKIEPNDFVKYFRVRFSELKNILLERNDLGDLSSINKITNQRQAVSIIGMVCDKRVSKNKNILIDIEDLTGRVRVLVNKDKVELYEKAKDIIIDDVVSVRGFGNREIIFANDVIYPDAFLNDKNFVDRDERAAFISDIHVGSANFLEKNFLKFIKWVNGEEGNDFQKQESKKIKYIFITGDSVDGVGIFPGQEDILSIKDIKEQYNKLAYYLSKIRKDIKIIICPGQHDAVRVAEPQPFIDRNYAGALYELDNVIFVSNPCFIEIENDNGKKGLKILMYHGASMHSFVEEIESLRLGKAHNNPSKVVKEMLKRRHLASIHSSVTYIPTEEKDHLCIKEIPDIINTADFHKPDIELYNNILIICSSCWQSITPFEEKVGNNPEPCKVPVLNLKTRQIKILDFSDSVEK
ncbi:MAG: metallophosphoesterase [Nanoarchaeota archaeon]|nr:metallophosphoesterase [Nanoarchaeota archaeon]